MCHFSKSCTKRQKKMKNMYVIKPFVFHIFNVNTTLWLFSSTLSLIIEIPSTLEIVYLVIIAVLVVLLFWGQVDAFAAKHLFQLRIKPLCRCFVIDDHQEHLFKL